MLRQVMSRWHFQATAILAIVLLGTTGGGEASRGESHVSVGNRARADAVFSHLPAAKLRAVVEFLSLLR
jgi:hypothetical protein